MAFPAGGRPHLAGVVEAVRRVGEALPFSLEWGGTGADEWAEVVASGVAFDLIGLEPAPPAKPVDAGHLFGLAADFDLALTELITLRPGAHLTGGENLLPVVRVMVEAGARIAGLLGAVALVWRPARTAIGTEQFARLVAAWLAGGAFPALGLTALVREEDGALRSEGLGFFTGQELRLAATIGSDDSYAGKIAVRLIHDLVDGGAVNRPHDFTGPNGELLHAEPGEGGRILNVWQKGQT